MSNFRSQCLEAAHGGELFLLHPHRVMYWPAKDTLFASDVHVGKEHVFGRSGIPIPAGISEASLKRLFTLARGSAAKRLIILGDFMHNVPLRSESWLGYLSQLLDEHTDLTVDIVAGNHDRKAGREIIDNRVRWHADRLIIDQIVLSHEPVDDSRGYVLSGHLHPAWRVGNARRGGVRAPVFWFRKNHMVMPAFGEFTGGVIIKPERQHDKLYITGPERVIEVPVIPSRSKTRANNLY